MIAIQEMVVIVVKSDFPAPPRRLVLAGHFGPGIAKVLVEEMFAARETIEAERKEVVNG